MSIHEMADYIRRNKCGINYPGVHPYDDESVVLQYTRHEMSEYVHITSHHILECCAKASSYDEHLALCRPIAKVDTEEWERQKSKPAQKGRTKRRFR